MLEDGISSMEQPSDLVANIPAVSLKNTKEKQTDMSHACIPCCFALIAAFSLAHAAGCRPRRSCLPSERRRMCLPDFMKLC